MINIFAADLSLWQVILTLARYSRTKQPHNDFLNKLRVFRVMTLSYYPEALLAAIKAA